MDKESFDRIIKLAHEEELEVKSQGQKEYAHSSDDVFDNFNRLSNLLGVPRETVLMIYALKHLDGIMSYLKGHRSQREDIRGRIKDLRMYLVLLRGMIDEERAREEEDEEEYLDIDSIGVEIDVIDT